MKKILVIAGTATDTQMGVDMVKRYGYDAIFCPLSANPTEQTLFQISDSASKNAFMLKLLSEYRGKADEVLIYCNSLSAAIDCEMLSEKTGFKIVTPLDVYKMFAGKYKKLAIIAANPNSADGIASLMFEKDPELSVCAMGWLGIVYAIERKMPPEDIIKKFHLADLFKWYKDCGFDAVVLGCTHFPYLKDEILKATDIPLIDPTDEMMQMLG